MNLDVSGEINVTEIISSTHDLCTGCNRCVRECPMETANITYLDESGNIRVSVDKDKCINCGRCLSVCKHEARDYIDDTVRFFDDLAAGARISLIAAPSIRTSIPEYKRLFTFLKKSGINKIYDVSFGADICVWAHVRYIENHNAGPMITQPCPVIVSYCESYRHELLKRLSPVHSPMACVSIYMKEYDGITDKIAALSPCIAKSIEFESTGLSHYNVTFAKLLKYIEANNIELPSAETGFDHAKSGLGSLFSMPGGLKENIDFYFNNKVRVSKAEGADIYRKLETYAFTPEELLPDIFDVLNCSEGCNIGPAVPKDQNLFLIDSRMSELRFSENDIDRKAWLDSIYSKYDENLDLSRFLREYKAIKQPRTMIDDDDIKRAFELLGKTTYEKQHVDCGACGSATCHDMARKLALGVNIPTNCMVFVMETAKVEHEEKLAAHERLALMEKLREGDERIRIILDSNPHINVLFNDKCEVLDCNPAAVSFLGFKDKQELIDGFLERVVTSIPEFQSSGRASIPLQERFESVIRDDAVSFETDLILNGKLLTLDVKFKKIPYAGHFAIVGYFYDMTAMHEREMQLQHAKEINELQLAKLDLSVKATKIGLWDMEIITDDPINPDNLFHWSDEFRHMLGYSDEADFPNVLRSWLERLHPEDLEITMDAFKKHILDSSGKTKYDVEYRMKKKEGHYGFYKASGETLRDSFGVPIRVVGSIMDITETKNILFETERQRVEAEAASKAKSAFLSTMSHEIRTPMNAIIGITEVQLQNEELDTDTKEALSKIYASGDMLLGIINDMLDLSKIESGKLELLSDKYEMASLISDSAQLNMMRIGNKQIDFELFVDENLPSVLLGDELRVKQILSNILSNAFKYTDRGKVSLSITIDYDSMVDDSAVVLKFIITDTGQGMSNEQMNKLFDEYSRFNMKANRTTEGTGLGMSITQNLIIMMGGSITVESEEGKGSVFTVFLPQVSLGYGKIGKEVAESLEKFKSNRNSQMRRALFTRELMPYGKVLIVDDVDTNIYVARGLMSPYALDIDSADSGFAAIDKIRDGSSYDIVFMDHMMPHMDGIETTQIIRALGYDRPIVALTANAVAGQAEVFLNNGFDDYISKPIDVRQLNTILNKLIRDRHQDERVKHNRKADESDRAFQEHLSIPDDHESDIHDIQASLDAQLSSDADAGYSKSNRYAKIDLRFADVFIRDAMKTLEAIEPIVQTGDFMDFDNLRTFTVFVHGIKSALASIGMSDLSAKALALETSARNNDYDLIVANAPSFVDSLRDLTTYLSTLDDEGLSSDAVADDLPSLRRALIKIVSSCGEYDEQGIEEAMSEIKKKSWSDPINELLASIDTHLLHSDFDEIIVTVSDYLDS